MTTSSVQRLRHPLSGNLGAVHIAAYATKKAIVDEASARTAITEITAD